MTTPLNAPDFRACVCSGPPPLVDPASTALFLDIDGTLIDIAPTPNAVTVSPVVLETLRTAHAAYGGAVALVTGRRIDDADRLLEPLRLAAAGVHGGELRASPGGAITVTATKISSDVLLRLAAIALRIPGVIVEPKGVGVAVHYRLAPTKKAELQLAIQAVLSESDVALAIAEGRMVFEILPADQSKGRAIEALLSQAPFAGRRPVMIGDDVGDMSAFDAVARRGGIGLRVAGEHFAPEVAELANPSAVCAWIQETIAQAPRTARSWRTH